MIANVRNMKDNISSVRKNRINTNNQPTCEIVLVEVEAFQPTFQVIGCPVVHVLVVVVPFGALL